MAEVQALGAPRREYITEGERSALRATWHTNSGYVVISLWRGDVCVATSHLAPQEAGRLARFITGGLADLASDVMQSTGPVVVMAASGLSARLRHVMASWPDRLAGMLESIARRLR